MHTKRNIVTLVLLLLVSTSMAAEYDARLDWSRKVELASLVSGIVEKVFVQPGQRVAKGKPLSQLNQTVYKAKLQQAKAATENRNEIYKEAKRELDRATVLYERTVLSDHDLQVAKNNLAKAKAGLERARAAQVEAQIGFDYSTLRAPYDIIVLKRFAEPGKVISTELKSETLFVAAQADKMLARFYVSESARIPLKEKQKAVVNINGESYQGYVQHIGLEPIEPQAQAPRYAVEVIFNTNGKTYAAARAVKVIIE